MDSLHLDGVKITRAVKKRLIDFYKLLEQYTGELVLIRERKQFISNSTVAFLTAQPGTKFTPTIEYIVTLGVLENAGIIKQQNDSFGGLYLIGPDYMYKEVHDGHRGTMNSYTEDTGPFPPIPPAFFRRTQAVVNNGYLFHRSTIHAKVEPSEHPRLHQIDIAVGDTSALKYLLGFSENELLEAVMTAPKHMDRIQLVHKLMADRYFGEDPHPGMIRYSVNEDPW